MLVRRAEDAAVALLERLSIPDAVRRLLRVRSSGGCTNFVKVA
jgi:hypothetical protein